MGSPRDIYRIDRWWSVWHLPILHCNNWLGKHVIVIWFLKTPPETNFNCAGSATINQWARTPSIQASFLLGSDHRITNAPEVGPSDRHDASIHMHHRQMWWPSILAINANGVAHQKISISANARRTSNGTLQPRATSAADPGVNMKTGKTKGRQRAMVKIDNVNRVSRNTGTLHNWRNMSCMLSMFFLV